MRLGTCALGRLWGPGRLRTWALVCLYACVPVCLVACVPVRLGARVPVRLRACTPATGRDPKKDNVEQYLFCFEKINSEAFPLI